MIGKNSPTAKPDSKSIGEILNFMSAMGSDTKGAQKMLAEMRDIQQASESALEKAQNDRVAAGTLNATTKVEKGRLLSEVAAAQKDLDEREKEVAKKEKAIEELYARHRAQLASEAKLSARNDDALRARAGDLDAREGALISLKRDLDRQVGALRMAQAACKEKESANGVFAAELAKRDERLKQAMRG